MKEELGVVAEGTGEVDEAVAEKEADGETAERRVAAEAVEAAGATGEAVDLAEATGEVAEEHAA